MSNPLRRWCISTTLLMVFLTATALFAKCGEAEQSSLADGVDLPWENHQVLSPVPLRLETAVAEEDFSGDAPEPIQSLVGMDAPFQAFNFGETFRAGSLMCWRNPPQYGWSGEQDGPVYQPSEYFYTPDQTASLAKSLPDGMGEIERYRFVLPNDLEGDQAETDRPVDLESPILFHRETRPWSDGLRIYTFAVERLRVDMRSRFSGADSRYEILHVDATKLKSDTLDRSEEQNEYQPVHFQPLLFDKWLGKATLIITLELPEDRTIFNQINRITFGPYLIDKWIDGTRPPCCRDNINIGGFKITR